MGVGLPSGVVVDSPRGETRSIFSCPPHMRMTLDPCATHRALAPNMFGQATSSQVASHPLRATSPIIGGVWRRVVMLIAACFRSSQAVHGIASGSVRRASALVSLVLVGVCRSVVCICVAILAQERQPWNEVAIVVRCLLVSSQAFSWAQSGCAEPLGHAGPLEMRCASFLRRRAPHCARAQFGCSSHVSVVLSALAAPVHCWRCCVCRGWRRNLLQHTLHPVRYRSVRGQARAMRY